MTPAPQGSPGDDGGRRSGALTRREIGKLLQLAGPQLRALPSLVLLGLAASLAETLGITLVVVFLQLAMAPGEPLPVVGGLLEMVFSTARRFLGTEHADLALMAAIVGLIAAKAGLGLAYSLLASNIRTALSERVRNRLHGRYLTMPYAEVRGYDQGELLDALATSSWALADAAMAVARMVISACSIMVFGAVLFGLSWRITLIAAAGSIALFASLHLLSRRARRLGEEMRQVNHGLALGSLVVLQGLRTIRAFGQERRFQEEFERASGRARTTGMAVEHLHALIPPATEVGYFILLCAVVVVAQASDTPFAITLACVALLYRLQPHLRELEANLLAVAQSEPAMRTVLAMLGDARMPAEPSGNLPFTGTRERIRFEGVGFTHPGASRAALADTSFEIPAGAVTAIIGESGAGKTTIVNLLLRLYHPGSGAILVDGTPLEAISREAWLSRLAVAGQDVELVEGTVADNIRLARPDATEVELRAAAEMAGALDFIVALPEGFDSWVGQQGLNFSGGQRQRIGIARAVLNDPDMLILDEATNALDATLEEEVRDRMRRAFAGRTLVLVTHRLDTALVADHVVHISAGRIVEAGPPASLPDLAAMRRPSFSDRRRPGTASAEIR